MNNLEFDHADIFDNLAAIQKQFHHVVRCIPSSGMIISPTDDENINEVLDMGCWSETQTLGNNITADQTIGICSKNDWQTQLIEADGSEFDVYHKGKLVGTVSWELIGEHNVSNAVMAIAAAHHAGVQLADAIQALSRFKNVKRRMELKGEIAGIKVYDDFAHHPTAIKTTLDGLRKKHPGSKIIAVLEPRSNTMKMGIHKDTLANSWQEADEIHLFEPNNLGWSLEEVVANSEVPVHVYHETQDIVTQVVDNAASGDQVLVMSNGGFNGIHQSLLDSLARKHLNG
jgi:UDP-N-acetylmuramate: L-alanyl-gamma-D-glutamyl-meso-diaminopimelate ligase